MPFEGSDCDWKEKIERERERERAYRKKCTCSLILSPLGKAHGLGLITNR
jgi:hypothetical protein